MPDTALEMQQSVVQRHHSDALLQRCLDMMNVSVWLAEAPICAWYAGQSTAGHYFG